MSPLIICWTEPIVHIHPINSRENRLIFTVYFFSDSQLKSTPETDCHSEERSDEEALIFQQTAKRFFAALRMTVFYIVRVWRAIRESPLRIIVAFQLDFPACEHSSHLSPDT